MEDYTNISLILDTDINEIKKWATYRVKHYLDILPITNGDINLCPWCIYYNVGKRGKALCRGCGYGERNGRCVVLKDGIITFSTLNENSRYGKIIDRLKSRYVTTHTIRSLPEMSDLIKLIKEMYSDLLDGTLTYEDMFDLVRVYWRRNE